MTELTEEELINISQKYVSDLGGGGISASVLAGLDPGKSSWIPALPGRGGLSMTSSRMTRFGTCFAAKSAVSAAYPSLVIVQIIVTGIWLAKGRPIRRVRNDDAAVLHWSWQHASTRNLILLTDIKAGAPQIGDTYALAGFDADKAMQCVGRLLELGAVSDWEDGHLKLVEEITFLDSLRISQFV